MKITIGGSMTFAREMTEAKNYLESQGHEVLMTDNLGKYLNSSTEIKQDFNRELNLSIEDDVMRLFFDKIAESDAYLVLNYSKKGVNGYLGTSVLMELGLSYYLKKKIYLLFDYDQTQSYALELAIINPIILGGDLIKIK